MILRPGIWGPGQGCWSPQRPSHLLPIFPLPARPGLLRVHAKGNLADPQRSTDLRQPWASASGHLPAFCLCPCQLSSTCPGRGCTITASCFWLGKTSQLSPGRAQCVSNSRSREGLRNQKWLLFTEPSTGQVFPRTLLFSSFSQA